MENMVHMALNRERIRPATVKKRKRKEKKNYVGGETTPYTN